MFCIHFYLFLFKSTHLWMLFNGRPLATAYFYCRPFLLCSFLLKNTHLRMIFNGRLSVTTYFYCRPFLLCSILFKNTDLQMLFNGRPLAAACFNTNHFYKIQKCRIMQCVLSIKLFIFDYSINEAHTLTFSSTILSLAFQ